MLFDNGCHRRGAPSHSRIVEVDPETNEIGWEYQGTPNISFFSYNISSAERQPNGNTVICEGAPGRIFEVTAAGEIVWEYINPLVWRCYRRQSAAERRIPGAPLRPRPSRPAQQRFRPGPPRQPEPAVCRRRPPRVRGFKHG